MFRTPVSLQPVEQPISINHRLLSWGSCFADFIGNMLLSYKFKITTNPCGIIFHPLAQFQLFRLALEDELPPENSYVCHQGIWYNYFFHSSISSSSRIDLQKTIGRRLDELRSMLATVDFILLTFGTAIQYRHKDTGLIVANCHRTTQKEFDKNLTPSKTIVESFKQLFDSKRVDARIILSVSPIRHLKEGVEQNCVSKSVLRVACEKLRKEHPGTSYFPGFEIMMDDLRDYRFYQKDMIHPNETARDYLWQIFVSNYLDDGAQQFVDQWHKISLNLEHRPFHPQSTAHRQFIKKTLSLIQALPPGIDTNNEIATLKKYLDES
jgi:hypothetical protein